MKNQFVTYEIAKKLKELGFDELCAFRFIHTDRAPQYPYPIIEDGYLNELQNTSLNSYEISAPLWQQAIDWLREEHLICILIYPVYMQQGLKVRYSIEISKVGEARKEAGGFLTHNEAREASIPKALELLNNQFN